jgi:hypothetical protein
LRQYLVSVVVSVAFGIRCNMLQASMKQNPYFMRCLEGFAEECDLLQSGKNPFRVRCIQPGSANSPRSSILSQDIELRLARLSTAL